MTRPLRLVITTLLLLILGACGESTDKANMQFLDAVKSGNLQESKRLLDDGADIDARDPKHNSPGVVWAAHEGHADVLEFLLDNGGSVEAAKAEGDTALWYAAQQGQLSTAEVLIKRGADPNPKGPDGLSAVAIAEKNGYPEIAALIRDAGGN